MLYRASILSAIIAILAMSSAIAQSAAESAADIELRLRRAASAMVAAEEERAGLEKRLAAERARIVETEVERDLNRDTVARLERDLSSAKAREGEVRKLLEALQSERRARQQAARPTSAPPRSVEPAEGDLGNLVKRITTLPGWLLPAGGLTIAVVAGAVLYMRRRHMAGSQLPDQSADPSQHRPARWGLAGAVALLALTIGVGSLAWVHQLDRSRQEAERLRLTPLLDQAGYNEGRLRELRESCRLACPPDIAGTIDARLQVIESESVIVRNAQDSIEKLRQYVSDCTACSLKEEAAVRIGELTREARAREVEKLEQSFAAAGQDEDLLRRFIDTCREPCPESLRASAQARLDVILQARQRELSRLREQESYKNARGNLALLRSYVVLCAVCEHSAAARSEIADLERQETRMREAQTYRSARGNLAALNSYMSSCSLCEFRSEARDEAAKLSEEEKLFALRVCNRTKDNLSVAVAGQRDPSSAQFRIEGWWNASPGECKIIGRWVKGTIYYHASAQGVTWGQGKKFCMSSRVYDRVNTNNYTCKGDEKLRDFTERTISSSEYTLNFDP